MKKFNLFLIFFMTTSRLVLGQMDINAVNKPVELLNSANEDIENGNYTDAVQKLLAAIRLEPKIREMYLSLNTACSHTNQISILKQYLIKAKAIFEEDDEICYYLGNIYQNENNFKKRSLNIAWLSNMLRKTEKISDWSMLTTKTEPVVI